MTYLSFSSEDKKKIFDEDNIFIGINFKNSGSFRYPEGVQKKKICQKQK